MADRICPSCAALVGEKLKFCRECGSRVDDAPAAAATPAAGSGDETMMASSPRRPPPPAEPEGDLAEEAEPGDGGDRTIMAGSVPRAAAPPPAAEAADDAEDEEEPGSAEVGDRTIIGGAVRRPAAPPPEEPGGLRASTATFVGAAPPASGPAPAAAPPPAPPPAAGPEIEEMEPVSDDIDMGDGSGATPAASPPPAPPPSRPAPPPTVAESPKPGKPAPAATVGACRLDHWSPRVKTESITLEKPETVVGRDRGDLKFPEDSYLSKKHARLWRDEQGRMRVEDLGTLNGTYLRLRAPLKLEHRDVIFVGRHSFRFELLQYEEQDDRTIEGDPLTRVQGVQGGAPRARIVKRQDEGFRGVPFFFGTAKYVLGRTDGTHNFQKDDLLSRRHAAIQYREGDYWLEDLGSQNGTFLRLRGPHVLETGDVIKMGDQYFKAL